MTSHMQLGIDRIHGFFSTNKKGKDTINESKIVTDTPPCFEQNYQTNPMSVRGEPAAAMFMVRYFTLPPINFE